MLDISKGWLDRTIINRREALARADAAADRLAIMREMARLHDGGLSLVAEGISLRPEEEALLDRFFMAKSHDSAFLRLVHDGLDDVVSGLAAVLPIDAKSRRLFQPAVADAVLRRLTTYADYQSQTQKAAVRALLTMPSGSALMVSMPTGSGKSLLFQIAPLWWAEQNPGACVVVITPTIALAEDHERTLGGIPALASSRAISSSVIGVERRAILDSFRRGEVPILLLSPEAALGAEVQEVLLEAAQPSERKFGLGARLMALFVDEAHIVDSWGRSFRPDFQRLPALAQKLRQENEHFRVVLLSATLGPASREELRRAYAGGDWLEIHSEAPRYEFDLVVANFDEPETRNATLLTAIDLVPRPAIVYVTRVEDAADLVTTLREQRGYRRIELFTGDVTSGAERRRIVNGWANNEFELVVATSAFGLGVDKADVRSVVHACLPETSARYYQEIGRASRDGFQGLGLCLWTSKKAKPKSDEGDAFGLAANSWLTRPIAESRWRALSQTASQAWEQGRLRLKINLDAARDGLGPYTGERNRNWNRTLLMLMQRAGALEVDVVRDPDGAAPIWELLLDWPELLEHGAHAELAWDQIFNLRNTEQAHAIAEHNRFAGLMRGSGGNCLLTGVFREIEPHVWDVLPCGRCPQCRSRGATLPTFLQSRGLDQVWLQDTGTSIKASPVLIVPTDPAFQIGLKALLSRLLDAGVEQFVVPDDIAGNVVLTLSEFSARHGFVLGISEWLRDGWQLAQLSTAVFLASDTREADLTLHRCRQFSSNEQRPIFLVADPAIQVSSRPLSQVSGLLSYDEEKLEIIGAKNSKSSGDMIA